jgi:nucleoside-diphosphate-sugar epimerase
MKKILVCGAGGFIGSHLVNSLKTQGHHVIGADLKFPDFEDSSADMFCLYDLRNPVLVENLITSDIDEVYQLAADMGGAGYISTGDNDADIMHNSMLINLNVLNEMAKKGVKKILYTSSACVYPEHNQVDPSNPICREDSVYPADPDSEYGWEKLFSERVYMSYARNHGIDVRIVRLHNVFGPMGTWTGGKEKAPAALCRKVAECPEGGTIDIWGPGIQTRSFLFIEECIEGIHKIMSSNVSIPLNLGSTRRITVNDLALLIAKIANKNLIIRNVDGPIGVMGRNSDNTLIEEKINWAPADNLEYGLEQTYKWIEGQLNDLQ